MQNNRSTIKFNLTVNSDSDSAPATTEIVWPNLTYEQVLVIEDAFLDAVKKLNDYGKESLKGVKK